MSWRRSAHSTSSTSSTSLLTHPSEVQDLNPLAIVDSIYGALAVKSYQGISNSDPSALETLGDRLLVRVQGEIRAVYFNTKVDWEIHVFRPIIAAFDFQEDLGISEGDTEYVFLLSTVLMVA
jgi:hypothetical protein